MINKSCSGQGNVRAHRRGSQFIGIPQVLAAGALAIVALGTGAQATLAYGTPLQCTARSQAAVFAPWGDKAYYFLASNGNFENGSTNWSLTGGASVASGNETSYVGARSDSHSLNIPAGGAAESRTFCVSRGEDVVRLFVNNSHTSGAILHVDATVVNPDTGAVGYSAFDVNGDVPSSAWSPTAQLKIPNLLGGSGTEQLTLRLSIRGTPTTWKVDDIYVDPFKSW